MKLTEPQRECPRWGKCSVNRCPLDPFQDDCDTHPDDKEQICGVAKTIRLKIGQKYPDLLPMLGLKPREWAGRQAYARLSLAEKAEIAKRGADRLKQHRQDQNTQNDTTPKTL